MINGGGLVIPLMATALISSRIANLFTPPLYEALAQQKYFPVPSPVMAEGRRQGPTQAPSSGDSR
jgi:hypothetical protein